MLHYNNMSLDFTRVILPNTLLLFPLFMKRDVLSSSNFDQWVLFINNQKYNFKAKKVWSKNQRESISKTCNFSDKAQVVWRTEFQVNTARVK